MKPEWRNYPEDCRDCNGQVEVYTTQTKEGWVNDEDPARCTKCGATGIVRVWDEDDVGIIWHE